MLRDWLASSSVVARTDPSESIVAAVAAEASGFVAVIRDDTGPHLVANVGSGITTAAESVAHALAAAGAREASFVPEAASTALHQLQQWLAARRGASTIDLQAAAAARLRRATLVRVARALARAPRHQRALLSPLAETARSVATAPLAEGAERILEMLVRAELPDEAWLRSIATFGELNVRPIERRDPSGAEVIAVILFTVCS
jgi:hypothetical protein